MVETMADSGAVKLKAGANVSTALSITTNWPFSMAMAIQPLGNGDFWLSCITGLIKTI